MQDSFPYGVQFSWTKDEGSVTSVVFEKGSSVPSAKMLTFYRGEPFALSAEYTPDSDIPPTADRAIGSWSVGPFALPAGIDKAKLKVKVSLNLNGVVGVDSVTLVEEEEYEEEAPVPAPLVQPADQTMEDAAAGTGRAEAVPSDAAERSGEGGSEAAAEVAAPAPAPMDAEALSMQKVVKRRVKKHSVPFAAATAALSSERLQALYEAECEMALQVRGASPLVVVVWVVVRVCVCVGVLSSQQPRRTSGPQFALATV